MEWTIEKAKELQAAYEDLRKYMGSLDDIDVYSIAETGTLYGWNPCIDQTIDKIQNLHRIRRSCEDKDEDWII